MDFLSFFDIDNVLLHVSNYKVSYLELLSVIAGLACVFFAVRARVFNFWLGYIYNIVLFILFFQKGLYSSMLVQPVSFMINAFGHYRWTHPNKGEENKEHQLKITVLSGKQRMHIVVLVLILTLLWGFAVSQVSTWMPWLVDAKFPYIDAFAMMAILTAQLLAAQKKIDTWGAWTMVNSTNMTIYLMGGLLFLFFVSAAKMVMVVFGFRIWYKKYKNED
jgi:nicotinamide mononucleotide transporter